MYMRVRNLSLRAHAVPEFPKAYHIVRRAALRLALTRALVKAAQIIKQMQARSSGASAGASITSIFDMALAHAAEARQLETAEKEEKRETEAEAEEAEVISEDKSVAIRKSKEEDLAALSWRELADRMVSKKPDGGGRGATGDASAADDASA